MPSRTEVADLLRRSADTLELSDKPGIHRELVAELRRSALDLEHIDERRSRRKKRKAMPSS